MPRGSTDQKLAARFSNNFTRATAPSRSRQTPATKSIAHHNAAHRLFEERKQHDEAEKHSEKTRLHREIERRHLDPNHIPKI